MSAAVVRDRSPPVAVGRSRFVAIGMYLLAVGRHRSRLAALGRGRLWPVVVGRDRS